jgi:hypothetical protein
LEKEYPDTPAGEPALIGTQKHEAFEKYLRMEPEELDYAPRNELTEFAEYIQCLAVLVEGEILAEIRVNPGLYLGFPEDLFWGTADVVIVGKSKMIIADLKTGRIPVNPEGNWQLISYLLGAIHRWGIRKEYRLLILQGGEVKAWVFKHGQLAHYASRLHSAITEALSHAPEFRPGDAQCQWCRASGDCAFQARFALQTDWGQDPWRLSPDRVVELLDKKKMIENFYSRLEERASMLALYDELPGYTMEPKITRDRWTVPNEELIQIWQQRQLPMELLLVPKTPAQARRVDSEAVEGLIERPDGQYTVKKVKS